MLNTLTHARSLALVDSLKVISVALTPSIHESFTTMRARVVVIPRNDGHTASLLGREVAASLLTV